jgi:hypothetical protein
MKSYTLLGKHALREVYRVETLDAAGAAVLVLEGVEYFDVEGTAMLSPGRPIFKTEAEATFWLAGPHTSDVGGSGEPSESDNGSRST